MEQFHSAWVNQYKSKIVSAEEAVRVVQSNQRIFLTGNCSVPQKLLQALIDYAPALENVEVAQALLIGPIPDCFNPSLEGHLRMNTLFISNVTRQGVQEGKADYTPVLLSEFTLLFKNNILPVDVAFIHLSPPDEHGFCSFGIETGLSKTPAESAKIIVAEVNEQMPRTLGDSFIHISRLNYIVPVNYPLNELPESPAGDETIVKIASHIADMIPDGATMQLGIGDIPNGVLKFLYSKKDLGIHTELFSNSVMELSEAGVITNARKSIHKGKIIAGFILGNQKLYQWVHNNPMIETHRTEYVNDPFVIAQNDRMVAINSAIEVDLTGQVCADSIGPKFYSGVGGQMDFIYGASRSKGGLPIIALPSTTFTKRPDGERKLTSRIVPMLKQGAGVVTTRNHVHYIVTEYGVADLYGKSIRQRAKALINIAHPEFRSQLEREAKELNFL